MKPAWSPRTLSGAAALALGAAACLRLDGFMFSGKAVAKDVDQMVSDVEVTKKCDTDGTCTLPRLGPAEGTYEEVWLKTEGAEPFDFNGYLVRPEPAADRGVWMLYCHGNSRHVGQYRDRVLEYQKMGFTVFIFDYPGYGKVAGPPTEQGIYDTVHAARKFVEEHPDRNGAPVVVYGWSLGGVPAIFTAAEQAPAVLVTESAFASPARFAEFGSFLDMPPGWLMDLKMDNEKRIKEVHAPLLIFHGTDDDFVEIKHGELLLAAANEPKEMVRVPGANHGDVIETDADAYKTALNAFLAEHLPAH
jgi:hypothetical protein